MEESTVNADAPDTEQIKLANGALLNIRPLRPGEEGAVRELCARLSLRTRYLRFFSALPVMPDSLVRMLGDVDDIRHLAVVAELDQAHGGHVVGLGNVGASDDERAEVGIVVADAWQRQGIGVALTASLLQAAETRGYRRFVVNGLWENPALRRLLNHVADVQSTSVRRGVMEITFVRRRPAPVLQPPRIDAKRSVEDLFEQAYKRILAAQGREHAKRRDPCL
jgi:GNAT superfamily N-acetyltransferase